MKFIKRTNLLFLAAIMCMAIACKKENKENNRAENSKTEVQVSVQNVEKTTKIAPVKKKITNAVKTKIPYQKKETYFSLPNSKGGNIDLANYAGKPVILFFFAEYCHYCKKAAPFIKGIDATYSEKGLVVLGISVDGIKDTADKFALEQNLNFPIAYDGAKISMKYKTRGVPYIFALDKNHEIVNVWAGYDEYFDAEILETVAEILEKQ
ncbi:MAG: TlpA family protein disulfide reductase [Elusimicrobia bacterium]|nr:TlpA family protein disulfide reductase [Elusimicrobiota bacterium]